MYRKITNAQQPKDAKCPTCNSTRLMVSHGALSCTNCGEKIGSVSNNKYGAKKTDYNGVKYDSRFEAECAAILDTRLKAGDVKAVDRQVKIPLEAYGKHIANYYLDFLVTHNDGHLEYVESKGIELPAFKMKWKMLEAKLALEDPSAEMTLWKQRSIKKVR